MRFKGIHLLNIRGEQSKFIYYLRRAFREYLNFPFVNVWGIVSMKFNGGSLFFRLLLNFSQSVVDRMIEPRFLIDNKGKVIVSPFGIGPNFS